MPGYSRIFVARTFSNLKPAIQQYLYINLSTCYTYSLCLVIAIKYFGIENPWEVFESHQQYSTNRSINSHISAEMSLPY